MRHPVSTLGWGAIDLFALVADADAPRLSPKVYIDFMEMLNWGEGKGGLMKIFPLRGNG